MKSYRHSNLPTYVLLGILDDWCVTLRCKYPSMPRHQAYRELLEFFPARVRKYVLATLPEETK